MLFYFNRETLRLTNLASASPRRSPDAKRAMSMSCGSWSLSLAKAAYTCFFCSRRAASSLVQLSTASFSSWVRSASFLSFCCSLRVSSSFFFASICSSIGATLASVAVWMFCRSERTRGCKVLMTRLYWSGIVP